MQADGIIAAMPDSPAPGPAAQKSPHDAPASSEPVDLFISYASSTEDEALLRELEKHLANLKRQGIVRTWHQGRVIPGEVRSDEIKAQLKAADVVLLLVSVDFMNSDACWDVEMAAALDRHRAGECAVIPVILRPCDMKGAPFAALKALPEGGKPVTKWEDREDAWLSVVEGIRTAIEKIPRP